MFANYKDFTDERNIYAQLGKHNIQHIPYILASGLSVSQDSVTVLLVSGLPQYVDSD